MKINPLQNYFLIVFQSNIFRNSPNFSQDVFPLKRTVLSESYLWVSFHYHTATVTEHRPFQLRFKKIKETKIIKKNKSIKKVYHPIIFYEKNNYC